MRRLSELSDKLDVTLESSKMVKLALAWVATTQSDAIATLHVQYVAVSCCLPAKQMAKSKQCKVPTKEYQYTGCSVIVLFFQSTQETVKVTRNSG